MTCTTRHRRSLMALSAALVTSAVLAGPAAAQDEPDVPRLGIAPIGYDRSWFDLEMDAGESQHLSVELTNHGAQQTDARTYPADVYTLIGGGMGVGLRGDPVTGTTGWLDYPTQTLTLAPDDGERHTFTVTVPPDTAAGQYIAALVIENDQPLPAAGELSVERVVRQALAVNITVSGPAAPALEITDARHTDPGGRSVVLLGVDNPGNRHLAPSGQLTLTDASGATVATHDVEMDTQFAGTETEVELALDELLAEGTYTITAELGDDQHDVQALGSRQFEVVAPPREGSVIPGRDRLEDAFHEAGLPSWTLMVVAVLLVSVLVLMIALLGRRLLRRQVRERELPETLPVSEPAPTPLTSRRDVAPSRSRRHPVAPTGPATRSTSSDTGLAADMGTFSSRTMPSRSEQRELARRRSGLRRPRR